MSPFSIQKLRAHPSTGLLRIHELAWVIHRFSVVAGGSWGGGGWGGDGGGLSPSRWSAKGFHGWSCVAAVPRKVNVSDCA